MSQYTKKEVTSYYQKRIKNPKLSSGQRKYAKKRFGELLGLGSVKVKKTVKHKGSTHFVKKKKVNILEKVYSNKQIDDSIIYYDSISKEMRKLGRPLSPKEIKHLERKSKYYNSFNLNERMSA